MTLPLGKLSPSLQTAPLCPQIGTATVSSWSQSDHGCYLTPWQQFHSLLADFIVNKMHQNVIDDRIVLLNSGKYWGIRIACSSCQFLVTAAATAAFSPFPVLNLWFCVNCSLPSYCNILTLPTNAAASTNIEQNSSQQSFKIYWKLRWESITVPRISARSRHTLLCLYLTSCKYASVYSCGA